MWRDISRLFAELRKRRVFRAAAIYAVAGWAAIQGAATLVPLLELPQWIGKAVVAVVAIAFPFVIALSWMFDQTSEGLVRTPGALRPQRAAYFALGIFVALTGAWFLMNRGDDASVDANVVAVLPFRVSGADPKLAYLREGMVDLLAAKLGGGEGARSVDSRTTLAAWRRAGGSDQEDLPPEAAVELGRKLGAGRILLGEIVGSSGHVVLSASVLRVPDGRVLAKRSRPGPIDSITAIVDKLAGELLALESGEHEYRLETLTSTSLPALQSYLEGQASYRRGEYFDAIKSYQKAIERDSTFALAALALIQAGGWVNPGVIPAAARVAWSSRQHLTQRDHALLISAVGPRFPSSPTGREMIDGASAATRVAPDQPEAWYELGDALFHYGAMVEAERPTERALEAFNRAIELDSSFAGPLEHAIELSASNGDTASVRELARLYFAHEPSGEIAEYLRWLTAAVLRDEAALARVWARADSLPTLSLVWIAGVGQSRNIRMEDVARAASALAHNRGVRSMRDLFMLHALALNRGRPREALQFWDRRSDMQLAPVRYGGRLAAALYWDGDTADAGVAARELASLPGQPLPADPEARAVHFTQLCFLEEWRAWHGEHASLTRSVATLRSAAPPDEQRTIEEARGCADKIETIAAVVASQPDARVRVARFDSLLRVGPPPTQSLAANGNLVLARLLEALGDRAGALRAIRRGGRVGTTVAPFLSTYLREEGRLAALTGDRPGAIEAYQHYLAIRSDPEPSVKPELERVRAELAKLTGERR